MLVCVFEKYVLSGNAKIDKKCVREDGDKKEAVETHFTVIP